MAISQKNSKVDSSEGSNYKEFLNQQMDMTHLTKREKEILSFIFQGLTAKRIGLILGISHRTVEHHIQNLKNKLNCNRRGEVIAMCIKINNLCFI